MSISKDDLYKFNTVPPAGVGGYDQCWYPVARSSDLENGQIIGEDYFGGRVVVYRGVSGEAHVMAAYCRHVGASLCTGEVLNEDVRCMFHHWRFGPDGQCTHIPSGEPIPERARMFTFPTAEKYGLIWAFNGEEPLYDLPKIPIDDSEIQWLVSEPHEEEQEFHMLISNSYDFQHLKWVHDLELTRLPEPDDIQFGDFGASYQAEFVDPKLGPMKQDHRLFGTNAFHLSGDFGGTRLIVLCAQIDLPGGRARMWSVAASFAGKTDEEREKVNGLLETGVGYSFKLMEDDYPITHCIRYADDVLVESDWGVRKYVTYLRGYPRFQPPVT